MTKMVMTIELEYDESMMHGDSFMAQKLFIDEILMGEDSDLALHSNLVGDEIGKVRVIGIDYAGKRTGSGEGSQK